MSSIAQIFAADAHDKLRIIYVLLLHGQPQLSQRRARKNADLHTHRQHLRAAMQQCMRPIRATRERYLNRPQTKVEMYLPGLTQTVTFDRAGETATFEVKIAFIIAQKEIM